MPLPLRQFTAVAGQATQFATLFNANFASGFEGPRRYLVDLTTPAGPSTAGGKQSLQHIRLVPLDGGPAIVIGQVSPVERSAELRTFRHLAELHALRFNGVRVPVDPNAHRDLARRMTAFFTAQGFSVVMVDLTETPMSERPPPPPRGGSATPWIIAGAAVAVAVGTAVLALVAARLPPRSPHPAAATATASAP